MHWFRKAHMHKRRVWSRLHKTSVRITRHRSVVFSGMVRALQLAQEPELVFEFVMLDLPHSAAKLVVAGRTVLAVLLRYPHEGFRLAVPFEGLPSAQPLHAVAFEAHDVVLVLGRYIFGVSAVGRQLFKYTKAKVFRIPL